MAADRDTASPQLADDLQMGSARQYGETYPSTHAALGDEKKYGKKAKRLIDA